jgi:hypothetical protein
LLLSNLGYNKKNQTISLHEDLSLQIFISKEDSAIQEISVLGDKTIYKLEPDKRVYLTANDASIQNAFAVDALENAPGAYIDIDGNVIVRGSSASVWINGKPSRRSAESLRDYLKLLPASQIEKIEVITNPSARYSATNTNTVVNIVLKKAENINNLIALGTFFVTDGRKGIWATTFIKKNKIDLNVYASLANGNIKSNIYDKSFSLLNNDTSFYSESERNNISLSLFKKVYGEFNYNLNENTTLGFQAEYDNFIYSDSFNNKYVRRYENPANLYAIINNKNEYKLGYFNINFNHNFDKEGHEISFEANYYKSITETNFGKIENNILETNSTLWESSPQEIDLNLSLTGNYTLPLNKNYSLEAGFQINPLLETSKTNIVKTSSDLNVILVSNNVLSNTFVKKLPTYEFYSTFSGKIYSVSYKLGLRYEYDIYDLNQNLPENYSQNEIYKNFYPSIHLSYQTKKEHSFSLSYSKRANSPFYNMNPFVDRTIIDYLSSGNPNLDFAETDSYEFAYFKSFKKIDVNFSLYQRNTKNDILSVSEPFYDTYSNQTVVLQSFANCGNSKFSGTEISLSSSPVKNLKLSFYANTYYQNLKGSYNNQILDFESFEYNAKVAVTYKFYKKFIVKINPYIISDKGNIFQNTKSLFYTDVYFTADFFNKKLSVDIRVKDIFNTKNFINEYFLNDFYRYSESDRITRMAQFVLIYRIGNSKFDREAKVNQLAR